MADQGNRPPGRRSSGAFTDVLPVGGIKEKLIAAARAGLRLVMVPERNAADVAEVPEEVTRVLEIRLVRTVDEVLAAALVPKAPPA